MKDVVPDREIANTDGTHFICMDLAPGSRSPVVSPLHNVLRVWPATDFLQFVMPQHRTDSIDYVILSACLVNGVPCFGRPEPDLVSLTPLV